MKKTRAPRAKKTVKIVEEEVDSAGSSPATSRPTTPPGTPSDGKEEFQPPLPPPPPPVLPSQPSRVPLADATGIAQPLSPFDLSEQLVRQKEREKEEREQKEREERVGKRVMEDIRPTAAQVRAHTAAEIGKMEAQAARKRMNTQLTESQQQRVNSEFIKTAEQFEGMQNDLIEKCARLNGYRDHYQGKIAFEFMNNYHPDMRGGRIKIENDLYNVELLLNTKDLPSGLKAFIVYIARGFEQLAVNYFGAPLEGIGEDIRLETVSRMPFLFIFPFTLFLGCRFL